MYEIDYFVDCAWVDFEHKDSYEQCEIIGNIVGWDVIAELAREHWKERLTLSFLDQQKEDWDDRV